MEKNRRTPQRIGTTVPSKIRDITVFDTILVELKNSNIPVENVERTSNLLEMILATLARDKAIIKDFSDEILFLNKLLETISNSLSPKELSLELISFQNLTLKTFHQLLKRTNRSDSPIYADILENLVDYLTVVKSAISKIGTQDSGNDSLVTLNGSALLLLKCIFYMATKCSVQYDSGRKVQLSGKFVGVIRCFLFYGLTKYDLNSIHPVNLYPAPLSQFKEESNNPSKKRRGKVNEDEDDDVLLQDLSTTLSSGGYSTSECSSSEIEDCTGSAAIRKELQNKKLYVKIRMFSYECLQSSIELFDIRQIFGFWSFLFPDSATDANASFAPFSVLKTISHDTSNKVRISALNFMYTFFDHGKQYVQLLVQDSIGGSSNRQPFTPLSVSLTAMIKELHRFFRYMLFKETNTSMLIVIYKVLSLIITITPYRKLNNRDPKDDILAPLFHQNSFMLDQKAIQIKNLSLALCVKLFGLQPQIPPQLESWLLNTEAGIESINKIFRHCFEFISAQEYILLIIESIKLFISILKHRSFATKLFRSKTIQLNIESICDTSIQIVQIDKASNNLVMQNLMCRFMYAIGAYLKDVVNDNNDQDQDLIFGSRDKMISFITQWYRTVLETRIFDAALVQQDLTRCQHSCQVTLINLISLIPESVFCAFLENTRFQIISILISLAKIDETPNDPTAASNDESTDLHVYTKSTAIRCLSILQSLRCLADDIGFTSDLLEICLDVLRTKRYKILPKKKQIHLLEHTLWAMANICDCVKKKSDQTNMDTILLNQVAFSLSELFDDIHGQIATDDILTNLVRCSGIVIYLVMIQNEDHDTGDNFEPPIFNQNRKANKLEPEVILKMIRKTTEILTKKNSYKLQWNICIAFSYLFPLERFVRLAAEILDQIFMALYHRFTGTQNHKVQSYSIYTITTITTLEHFQAHLKDLWLSTVQTFIRNYHIVAENSRRSWMEKFSHAIERLYRDYVRSNGDDPEIQQGLYELMEFMAAVSGEDPETIKNIQIDSAGQCLTESLRQLSICNGSNVGLEDF